MTVRFTCSCGKALKVPDNYIGRKVKCPGCKISVPVPTPVPETPAPPPGILQFACSCGQQMQAKEEYAGQAAKCPACGATVTIPAAGAPAPSNTYAPAPSGPAEEEYFEASRRRKMSFFSLVLGGATLFLCLGLVAGVFFYFWGGVPTDLALVPEDAVGFVTIRVSEVWENETLKKELPNNVETTIKGLEKQFGLDPSKVERLTVVAQSIFNLDAGWIIVATHDPYDKSKLISALGLDDKEETYRGKAYHLPKGQGDEALYPVSDTVFVVASKAGVQACIDRKPRTTNGGPLGKALKQAAGSNHFVAAFAPPRGLLRSLADEVAPYEGKDKLDLSWKNELESMSVVMNLDTSLSIRFTFGFGSAQSATEAQAALEKNKATLAGWLPDTFEEDAAKQLGEISKEVEFEQRGSDVSVSVSFELDKKLARALVGPLLLLD